MDKVESIENINIESIGKKGNRKTENKIHARLMEMIHDNHYMQMLGIEITDLKKGYAKGRMKYCNELKNPYGSLHGGSLYSLADVISGTAACTGGRYASTVSGNMNFIRPAMATEYVYCTAREVRQGKQLAVYDVVLTDDNEEVLENGSFTFFLMEDKVCS